MKICNNTRIQKTLILHFAGNNNYLVHPKFSGLCPSSRLFVHKCFTYSDLFICNLRTLGKGMIRLSAPLAAFNIPLVFIILWLIESGIYSPEFILARRKAMFSGFKYASVQSGLERAITHENDWKEVADGKFDLGAFVSFDKIGEYLLGGFLWQCIHTFLTFLSYLGGLGMLHVLIEKLLSNLNYTLPVKIKLKPQRVSQRRIHQERRMHFNWSDFGDDVETNGSSDSQRRFYQKRRSHFQDDVESNCSFDSDDNDVEKTDYDYDCDFEAPPPYYSDPTAPDL